MPALTPPPARTRLLAAVLTLPLLAACGDTSDSSSSSSTSGSSDTPSSSSSGPAPGSNEREVAKVTPRVLLAQEGGLTLLDTETGKVVDQHAMPGFVRLNPAGDGRRAMVTSGDQFHVYDGGIENQPHGDHHHAYQYEPGMTSVRYAAKHPGHVVVHGEKTVLFGDGDGSIQVVPTQQIGSASAPVQKHRTSSPHHGVAVSLADGSLLTTQGTEKSRSTVELQRAGKAVTRTTDCPGVHGEAVAQPSGGQDVAVLGCENGPVVLRGGAFLKVKAKDSYARTGNLAGSEASPVVLGDYKVQKDAEIERPTRVSLIDTRNDSLRLVELGSSYWFRSLARGAHGEALVLTYDGRLVVIDPASGKITKRIPVISAWKEKDDWQQPGPVVQVAGERAYVTDAATKQLVVVDLHDGKVVKKHQLAKPAVEMTVLTGEAPSHDEHEGHSH